MNDKIIVNERCRTIRHIAKDALRGNFFKVGLGFIIFYILTTVVGDLLDEYSTVTRIVYFQGYQIPVSIGIGSNLYSFLLYGAFSLGLCMFILNFLRYGKTEYGRLFGGFEYFGKTFLLNLVISIKVFLWALLFVIPGIIAAIRYSQSFYILADHPEYRVIDCVNESKYLMDGNKEKYFLLILSYIGWIFLGGLPLDIYNTLLSANIIAVNDTVSYIILLLLNIPALFVTTYIRSGVTVFYDLVTGKLAPVNEVNNENC